MVGCRRLELMAAARENLGDFPQIHTEFHGSITDGPRSGPRSTRGSGLKWLSRVGRGIIWVGCGSAANIP